MAHCFHFLVFFFFMYVCMYGMHEYLYVYGCKHVCVGALLRCVYTLEGQRLILAVFFDSSPAEAGYVHG